MTISANSYGSIQEIAQMVPRYADDIGTFNDTTNPRGKAVENMIDRVSGLVNSYLSTLGFSVPITQADAKAAMDNIVVETVATMVEGVRGTGRYSPKNKAIAERGQWAIISQEVRTYLDDIATGLENLGAARTGERTMGTVSVIRADGYSDDVNNLEWGNYQP